MGAEVQKRMASERSVYVPLPSKWFTTKSFLFGLVRRQHVIDLKNERVELKGRWQILLITILWDKY